MPIIRCSRLYLCYCCIWCVMPWLLVVGCYEQSSRLCVWDEGYCATRTDKIFINVMLQHITAHHVAKMPHILGMTWGVKNRTKKYSGKVPTDCTLSMPTNTICLQNCLLLYFIRFNISILTCILLTSTDWHLILPYKNKATTVTLILCISNAWTWQLSVETRSHVICSITCNCVDGDQ